MKSNKEQTQRSALIKMNIIGANIDDFFVDKKYLRYVKTYYHFSFLRNYNKPFTVSQMSLIDNIYEHLMKISGFDDCDVKHDFLKDFGK